MLEPLARERVASRWSDLGRRAASALILAPVALLCIWFGGAGYVALLMLAGVGLAAEWTRLFGVRVLTRGGLVVLGAVILAGGLTVLGQAAIGLLVLLAGFGTVWLAAGGGALAAGVLCLGLPLVSLLWLRGGASVAGRGDVLFVVLVVWASDIGAYVVGRLLRGPKLAPALSPAKTWSGALGGLLAAIVMGEVAGRGALVETALLAALLAIVCQMGDLLESAVKRHVGVKDSGHLIPGHGGLLDRLDGLLAASPVAALVVLVSREGLFWH